MDFDFVDCCSDLLNFGEQDSLRNCSKVTDFAYCSEEVLSSADMKQQEDALALDLEQEALKSLTGF